MTEHKERVGRTPSGQQLNVRVSALSFPKVFRYNHKEDRFMCPDQRVTSAAEYASNVNRRK